MNSLNDINNLLGTLSKYIKSFTRKTTRPFHAEVTSAMVGGRGSVTSGSTDPRRFALKSRFRKVDRRLRSDGRDRSLQPASDKDVRWQSLSWKD